MIRGDKPSGYFSTTDAEGRKIEGETRQCVHCQYTWIYKPGSGIVRGMCMSCKGLICARTQCLAEQKERVRILNDSHRHCVNAAEWQYYLREQKDKGEVAYGKINEGFVLHESGLIIPRE